MVHYEADITSIPQPTESEVARPAKLLLGIAALVIIGASAAVLLGFFLGGFRALYRIARGKPASSVYEDGVHQSQSAGLTGMRNAECGSRIRRVNRRLETCGKMGINPKKHP